jgi:hypothetical protein
MKAFDQSLHDQTDLKAKNALKKLLEDSMYHIIDNPDIHGVDLFLIHKGIHCANVEVEIKTNWQPKGKFEFDTVNFLRRKEKYCVLSEPTMFVIFNRDLSQYLTVYSKDIMSCPLEEVKNKYIANGEFFRKIPLTKVIFNKIYSSVEGLVKL